MITTASRFPRRPLRRSLLMLGVAGALLPRLAVAQAAPPAASPAAAVDAYVEKAMNVRRVPGASVAVIKDGKIVVAKGYGFADTDKSIKATEQTVYQLASVTKQFTAAAILLLVEDGKVSLDGKITEILPGLPTAWSGVTVRHLLTHTSGIKSYTEVFGQQKTPDSQVFTNDQILALVKDLPLQSAPGEKHAYCNTGYYLLGMIVEKASGKPYATFVSERIFTPLGMTASGYDDYDDARPIRARGYQSSGSSVTASEHTHPTQPFAAGALVSTVVDLAKWDAALDARKLLKPASYEAMWTAVKLNGGATANYGFGWVVDSVNGHRRVSHGGGITGFSTFISRFPDDKLTVIVLTNMSGGAAGAMTAGIAELLVPALAPPAAKPIADKDPTTTASLRAMITAAAAGNADPELLTPEFRTFLLPDRIKDGPQMMGRFGPLNAFDVIEETMRDANRVRVYRAVFGTTPIRCTFVLTPDNKIAGLRVEPMN
jgi:CubicO group peptidase (beta-lactamase class C family)